MVAGPGNSDPYAQIAERITALEAALEEQGRRAIPDADVPLYPLFSPNTPLVGTSPNQRLDSGGNSAWTTRLSTTEESYWEGRIGEVWHPTLYVDGRWGIVLGPAGTATYRVYVDDNLIGSFTHGNENVTANHGPYDISPYLRRTNIGVRLTLQCNQSGDEFSRVLIEPLGCLQRRA